MLSTRLIHIVTLFGAGVVIFGCASNNSQVKKDKNPSDPEVTTVDFVHVGQGISDWGPGGEYFGPQFLMFTSQETWGAKKDLFYLHPGAADSAGMKAIESVDFARQRVLVFTYGQVGTTGYSIQLDSIETNDTTSFYLTGISPDTDEEVGEAMTHPIDMVLINRTDLPEKLRFYINGQETEFQVHIE
jgi:hypothetical protein